MSHGTLQVQIMVYF